MRSILLDPPSDERATGETKRTKYLLMLVAASMLWGTTEVVAKRALAEISPQALSLLRFSVAALAFAPLVIARRDRLPKRLREWLPFLGLGLCGFCLNFLLLYRGLALAPASHATVLRVGEALFILLLSAILLREKIGRLAMLGLMLGTAGSLTIMEIDFSDLSLFAAGYRLGDLIIIAAVGIESFYTIIGKPTLQKYDPLTATGIACLCGWLMLLIVFGPGVGRELAGIRPSWPTWAAATYLGLAATVVAYSFYFTALSKLSSHRVGISLVIQPLVGVPLAALVFYEPLTLSFIIGASLIVGGVYLAIARQS